MCLAHTRCCVLAAIIVSTKCFPVPSAGLDMVLGSKHMAESEMKTPPRASAPVLMECSVGLAWWATHVGCRVLGWPGLEELRGGQGWGSWELMRAGRVQVGLDRCCGESLVGEVQTVWPIPADQASHLSSLGLPTRSSIPSPQLA